MSDNLPAPSVATQVRQANSDSNGKCLVCGAEPDWWCDEVAHDHAKSPTHGRACLPVTEQSKPAQSTEPNVLGLIVKDLLDRAAMRRKEAWTTTQRNGGDPLLDAYHRALDLAICLRHAIKESGSKDTAPIRKRIRDLNGDSW